MKHRIDVLQDTDEGLPLPFDPVVEHASRPRVERWDQRRIAGDEVLRLVHQVFLPQTDRSPSVVALAGVDNDHGCGQICTLVAEVLAGDPMRSVCLVETDFRSPDLLGPWGEDGYGLADALVRKGPIRAFARPSHTANNLWVLGCGTLVADCYNVFASGALRERVAELRTEFDFVIMHAASLTRYADAIGLGQLADGLIVVVEAGVTRRDETARVLATLKASKVGVLAAVLNNRTSPIPEELYKLL
jgi:Mrp family chromosome partitioning ATPase